jgi:hypothetical protein
MFLGVLLIGGLFMADHKEFFDAAAVDKAAGMKWPYVGAQSPPEGKVNLPIKSLTTGEPTILFITE